MATKTASLKVPGLTALPTNTPFLVYEKGSAFFEANRVGAEIDLVLDDGSKKKGTIKNMQVDPLINMINGNGVTQYGAMVGQVYSPLVLVQLLTDQAGVEVLDVTKLYTAVTVQVAYEPPAVQPAG